jgi:hypothetical protein
MEEIEREFEKRKPWITQYNIDGVKYGGNLSFGSDIRVNWFFDCFPDAHTILELGCLEGGQTFELAKKQGMDITSIEGRTNNLSKAEFVRKLLKIKNVKFIHANLEKTKLLLCRKPQRREIVRTYEGYIQSFFR